VYTPQQVVEVARRCGLAALAITDHDTLDAVPAARASAGNSLEIISGVEITAEYQQREIHLLGYFVALDHPGLNAALETIRSHRAARFQEMIERLRALGVSLSNEDRASIPAQPVALGRRNLAELLVRSGCVPSVREAFRQYLGDRGGVVVPKMRLPAAEALALVREAGGVAAWAHPSYHGTREHVTELRDLGLGAVEAVYPDVRSARVRELRSWADALGLAVTGGSDCHGPGRRPVGACTISTGELDHLRTKARPPESCEISDDG
jgi:predicted metal-dependent phosphoesterase TrpH